MMQKGKTKLLGIRYFDKNGNHIDVKSYEQDIQRVIENHAGEKQNIINDLINYGCAKQELHSCKDCDYYNSDTKCENCFNYKFFQTTINDKTI
jgi:recombinational DNA repair protein RecR